ncbi:PAS domain S-box protein [uncultured Lutibacter sp.]|uniref:PAS domain S-box protein n=1 Tax=uncultured Lutibacter sp. TaxID=437739 RepID=UPI00261542AA|nr:PAS domain S-box protein [uncultured Lutibacter sp.]
MIGNKEIEKLKFFELLLNELNSIIVSSDKNGNITYISPATEKILGYKIKDLLGKRWWKLTFLSKEEGKLFKDKVCDLVSGKKIIDNKPYERKLKCLDGSFKWIEWRDSISINNTFVSIGIDISEWKKTEEKKIQSDTILKNMDSMVMVSNSEGNIIFSTPVVKNIIGYSKEEIMGDKWWKVTFDNPHEAEKVKNAIHKYLFFNEKDFTDITKRKIKTKDGNYKWIKWQISKGVNNTYISIGTDITSIILKDLELKKAKNIAEESLKVKNEFLTNMSHEIRTPLNAVIGFTDLLLETELTSEQQLHLETMRNSGEILLSLINNVLDLSKLESDKLEIEEISFDLHKNLNEVVRIMKIKANEKKISLELNIDTNIPKIVIGDPNRLGQILLNLIGNAVKFTNEGFVKVSVKQLSEVNNISTILFEIKDTGIGIVSNRINTVFGAFTQAKSDTSRIYGGTGLGLTIVKKIVSLLNGEIKVESEFGKGSIFKIIVPLKKSSEIIKNTIEEDILFDKPLGLNILLVDDNKTNQLLAKTRLLRWKCNVDIANNGIEGVKKVQRKLYDIILMDIQMPIMDGYEAAKIIKNDLSEQVSKIPIIAMSAYTSKTDIKRALDADMDDYIFKPFKPKELYKLLEKYGNVQRTNKTNEIDVAKTTYKSNEIVKYINLKFLKEETFNESSIMILLIKSFVIEIEEFLSIMDKEFKNKNWEQLHKATHKIKPSVTLFGISKLDPIIHTLVNRFREEKQLDTIEELIISCRKICEHVKMELLTELKTLDSE